MSSASSSASSSTAPHVSPVLGYSSIRSRYPTSEKDLELEFELRIREMKKIVEARKRMIADSDVGTDAGGGAYNNERSARMNACDVNGDEFQIVCEELWIDFRRWVNHNEHVSDCISKIRSKFVSNWEPICFTLGFLIWFRWYIGAGKDACSYGFGYGVLSFACEVLRILGEIVSAFILMFIGFCVGLVPMLVCICFYEFNDAFPDPEGDEDDEDEEGDEEGDEDAKADSEHLKKE
jgi:hypothetical protein